MEENNNNENQVVNKVKDTVKKETKDFGKKAFKKFIKVAWPFIAKLIIILLVLGLINVVFYTIQSFFKNLFSADDPEVSAESSEEDILVEIDSGGRYKLKDDYAEEILAQLEEKYVSNIAMGFTDDEYEEQKNSENTEDEEESEEDDEDDNDIESMIDKYIEASLTTMLPDNGKILNDVDGIVKIKRTLQDGYLSYLNYDNFMARFNSGQGANMLRYFTLSDEFKLCIVVEKSSTTCYDYEGNKIEDMCSGGGYEIQEVDYQKYIEGYATPLNFFISLHLIAQNNNFMNEVVDMVKRKGVEDPIVLTYVESETTTTETIEYSGDQQINYVKYQKDTEEGGNWEIVADGFKENWYDVINNDNISEYMEPSPVYAEMVVKTYSGSWNVTKADTWIINVEKEAVESPIPNPDSTETEECPDVLLDKYWWVDYINGLQQEWERDGNLVSYKRYYIAKCFNIEKTTTVEVTGERWSATNETKTMKVDDFVEFIQENYTDVENNLTTAPSNLFYFLQQSESTQKHEKIMRYVIYKLSGIDYGITEENVEDVFNRLFSNYNFATGTYGNTIEEKIWFALLDAGYSKIAAVAVLGNLYAESGLRTNNLENYYESSLGYSDEEYTEAVNNGEYARDQFINDSAGYGLAQWTYYTRKEGLYDFAKSREASIDDVNIQIEYLIGEISLSGGADGYASCEVGVTRHGYNYYDFVNAETVEDATIAFCWIFENPGSPNMTTRTQKANEYYNELQNRTKGITLGGITTDEEAADLQSLIENEWIHTIVHNSNYQMQNGPFLEYWESPYNMLTAFQCTWWANGRASMYLDEFGTKYEKYPTQMGNGGEYYSINASNGWFEYGQEPRPNSIISWSFGEYGHVAYVEGVTNDCIYISHAGSGKSWYGVQKLDISAYMHGVPPNGYIYLDSPKN